MEGHMYPTDQRFLERSSDQKVVLHEQPHHDDFHAGGRGEDHHHQQQQQQQHEKKSVLTKVKDKAKKLKDTIGRKTHLEHGHRDDRKDDQRGVGAVGIPRDYAEEEDEEEDMISSAKPEIYGAPMYESEKVIGVTNVELHEDPNARRGDSFTPGIYEAAVSSKKGFHGDAGIASPVLHSLDATRLEDKSRPRSNTDIKASDVSHGSHDQFEPEQVKPESPTETDSKYQPSQEGQEYVNTINSTTASLIATATTTLVETAESAKEAIVSKLTLGFGGNGTSTDEGTGRNLAEKLEPGEEDKALAEVITEAVQVTSRKDHGGDGQGGVKPQGMVEKVKEVVTSLVGEGGRADIQPQQPQHHVSWEKKSGNEDFGGGHAARREDERLGQLQESTI